MKLSPKRSLPTQLIDIGGLTGKIDFIDIFDRLSEHDIPVTV